MENQRKIYGAGAVNIDTSRSDFPLSVHRNLSEKHSSSNMLYQYVKPWALFRYGTMVHWQPQRNVEKQTKKRRTGARSNLRTRGKASVYLDNCKEENIDLCSSNSLSKSPPPCRSPPREDGPPPPPGGRSPSDGPPPPPGGPYYHRKEFSIRYVQRAANVWRPTP